MDLTLQIFGGALVVFALLDLYIVVLSVKQSPGKFTFYLLKALWPVFTIPSQFSPRGGVRLLAHAGPVLLVVTVGVWGVLLMLGFALIILPELGTGIQALAGQEVDRTFSAALYYAGTSFTTLGTGDLVPRTPFLRVFMVFEAAIGFSYITLTFTYVMQVYTVVRHRTTLGLLLYHKTGDTGSAIAYTANLVGNPRPINIESELVQIAESVTGYEESHRFYPILHFFHFRQPYYSMAEIVLVALDTATLIRSVLDTERYGWLIGSTAVNSLWLSGIHILKTIHRGLLPYRAGRPYDVADFNPTDWRGHFEEAVQRFQQEGISCRGDLEGAYEEYARLRQEWNDDLRELSNATGYDWLVVAQRGASKRKGPSEEDS